MSPEETTDYSLAALFHFRYIRIHPFEDGNGRIARLLVNYILYRHGYPMIVIPAADRKNYLNALGQCDKNTGLLPADGANASLEQAKPLVEYVAALVERKLTLSIQLATDQIKNIEETTENANNVPEITLENKQDSKKSKSNVPENVPEKFADKRHLIIIDFIKMNNKIAIPEIANILRVHEKTIKRDIAKLKAKGIIERIGGDRGGYWKVIPNCYPDSIV